jgi:hypothetical protein
MQVAIESSQRAFTWSGSRLCFFPFLAAGYPADSETDKKHENHQKAPTEAVFLVGNAISHHLSLQKTFIAKSNRPIAVVS